MTSSTRTTKLSLNDSSTEESELPDKGYYSGGRPSTCSPPFEQHSRFSNSISGCFATTFCVGPTLQKSRRCSEILSVSAGAERLKTTMLYLVVPTEHFMQNTLKNFLISKGSDVIERFRLLWLDDKETTLNKPTIFNEKKLTKQLLFYSDIFNTSCDVVTSEFGREIITSLVANSNTELFAVASNLEDFINSIEGFRSICDQNNPTSSWKREGSSYRAFADSSSLIVEIQTEMPILHLFTSGILQKLSSLLFNINIICDVITPVETLSQILYRLHHDGDDVTPSIASFQLRLIDDDVEARSRFLSDYRGQITNPPKRAMTSSPRIMTSNFCRIFPFHVIINRDFRVLQVGAALLRAIHVDRGFEVIFENNLFTDLFQVSTPNFENMQISFESVYARLNQTFSIQLVQKNKQIGAKMQIRGQMIFCRRKNLLIFFGSPYIRRLDQLSGFCSYISDIPIHDATRDVILVGEQSKAQEGLKRRMRKLR